MPVIRGAVITLDSPRLADDLTLAASLGLAEVRFRVPWATAQPRSGELHGGTVEHLHDACALAHRHGLAPWLTLLAGRRPALPPWFDDDGGFADARNAGRHWPRWVEAMAEAVGDQVAGWVPMEDPFALAAAIGPADPRRHGEVVDTLVTGWRDAWRILRGGPPVACVVDVAVVRPTDESPDALASARRIDQLRWGVWLEGLAAGRVFIPGRAEREVPDLAGACDVVGVSIAGGPADINGELDVEALLHRAAEMGPDRPRALTFRPAGRTDADRSASIEGMWRGVHRCAGEIALGVVVIDPFADDPVTGPGIVTADREPKDAAHAFVTG